MGRVCTVCTSPQRAKIDDLLTKGQSAASIEATTGVGVHAIGRHKLSHLSPALTAIAGRREERRVGGLVDRLEDVTAAAERMLFKAETDGASGQMMGWVREFRACVELLAKLTGQLAPDRPAVTVNVLASPEIQTLVTSLLGALAPFPDARLAAADVLDGVGAEVAS